jgi:hypothetical protein
VRKQLIVPGAQRDKPLTALSRRPFGTGWDFSTDVGWDPADAYGYKASATPQAVRNQALNFTGPGVLTVKQYGRQQN